ARDLNGGKVPLGLYRLLVPDGPSRGFEGLHVYYIHDFSVNGVYMGEDFAIVRETASLREVEGGIDEPIPRVTAHELGHALGLSHRQDRTNLLASGTTGTILNTAEVETARSRAQETEGARTVEQLRDQARTAEDEGRLDDAIQAWQWLSQIPGDQADQARQKLQDLESRGA
ncbi:MAG TPA: matrixin family metalloprotease, partial [Isosphaeraceae bacterium]|nr:matrixin family metalloprotease [Isosphaeraceae bacterium]